MDAVKYLEEKQRMCGSCDCGNCEMSYTINGTGLVCRKFESAEAKKAVAIVEKWSVEHPRKTRKDVFREMFPNADVEGICPYALWGGICVRKSNKCSCDDCIDKFWNGDAPDWFGKGGAE